MDLLTTEILIKLPKFYQQEQEKDPVFYVKLFTPWANWTWYIMEFNENTNCCFGLVEGFETEMGYFDLKELEAIKGPMGLKIERDLSFIPTKKSELKTK